MMTTITADVNEIDESFYLRQISANVQTIKRVVVFFFGLWCIGAFLGALALVVSIVALGGS